MRKFSWRIGGILLAMTLLVSGCNLLTSLQGPDDKAITSDIQAKLFQDPVLKTRDIRILSQKGVVVLTGTVNDDQEKAEVERIAGEVKVVKQIIDLLAVAPPAPAPSAVVTAPAEPPANVAASPPPPPPPRRRRPRRSAGAEPFEQPPAIAESAPPPAAPAAARPPAQAPYEPAPPSPPEEATIQAGETITVRTIDPIDSSRNRAGEEFAASVDADVMVDNQVVIPSGSDARVRLVKAKKAGIFKGKSELQVELASVTVNDKTYNVKSDAIVRAGDTAEEPIVGIIIYSNKQVNIPSGSELDFKLKSPLTVTP